MADDKNHEHTDACQDCGNVHKSPYSKELLTAFDDWQKATDPTEKEMLFLLIAEQFTEDTQSSDLTLTDVAHDAVDTYRRAQLAAEQAAASLARLVVRALQAYDARKKLMRQLPEPLVVVVPPAGEPKGGVN